jgi:uncharacterized membrane protein
MSRVLQLLPPNWFADLLLGIGLLLGLVLLVRRARRRAGSRLLLAAAAGFVLAGAGGLLLPAVAALAVAAGAVAILVVLFVVLLLSGWWSEKAGWACAALFALGAGGLVARPAQEGLEEGAKLIAAMEVLQPWWLMGLLLIPLLVLFSYRSLAGLGPIRRWVALGLRCLIVLLLILALAETRLHRQSEHTTVLFLWDLSLSIPEDPGKDAKGDTIDLRRQRMKRFINEAVEFRGSAHERDRAGLIVFGRRPHLELPPSDAPRFNFREVQSQVDGNYTDIGAAIKLALASFPEKTGKRIVLMSDGNENLGNAEEQARLARENGVEIDVLPLAAGHRKENEVLVQSIEAPPLVEQGAHLPIRVLVRSYNPNVVVGTLTVKQTSEGHSEHVPGSPRKNVALQQGLNSFSFQQPLSAEQRSYTYEAEFLPEGVYRQEGNKLVPIEKGLPGDRPQNNRATTHVVARGQRRILLIEPHTGDHQFLVDTLTRSTAKFQVDTIPVDRLPPEKDKMAVLLSNYDCVILANVAASDIAAGNVDENVGATITEAQQEVIRSNTHDQGCGLIMIGGPNGFGAGGWRGTAIEKALPVDCDIKSVEVGGRGGLVLIMHASEIAEGNLWQKRVAELAIRKLSSNDMLGILHYSWGGPGGAGHQWHVPFQEVGPSRNRMIALLRSMEPGDMPDVDPALEKAYGELTKPAYGLTTKHIIFISDGDHWQASPTLLAKLRANKITVTTVCITSHGQLEEQKMFSVARQTNGRFYSVKNAKNLPAIYTRETRIVSQSLLYEKKFQPHEAFRGGPTEKLPENLPPLYGFVRTTAKPNALVETSILSPEIVGQTFPILSYWHYGLGKAAAFTSDARTTAQKNLLGWDRDWARSPMYVKFWEQLLDWTLRPVESKRLFMATEYKDGKVQVDVEARDDNGKPEIHLSLRGGVTTPGDRPDEAHVRELQFEQKAPGQYVAEFKAEEAGSYFVSAQAVRKVEVRDRNGKVKGEIEEGFDSARSGVTIPYSPEFSDLESNTSLLEKLRSMTDGKVYPDDGPELQQIARAGSANVFRPTSPRFFPLQPIWYWLLVAAGVVLFGDVAVRRIALDPLAVSAAAGRWWERLRGRGQAAERVPEFIERLKSRKAEISESLQRERAARRFDAGERPAAAPVGGADLPARPAAPSRPAAAPGPSLAPQQESQEPADYASRLLKAKRKVREELDKDKDRPNP